MVIVSGSLAYDYIMDFPGYFRDHILPEKLHVLSVSFLISKMERNFGGTAGNIAYNLALLGERPTILASAGNDFSDYAAWFKSGGMRNRRSAGFHAPPRAAHKVPRYTGNVNLSCVRQVKDVPTAGAYIMTDQADNQITAFHPGAMRRRCQMSDVRCQMLARKARLAIVSPGNLEDMKRLPRLYKKYGVPYIYDPGQAIGGLSSADLRAGISGARVLISNDYELAMVLKKTGWKKGEMLKRVEVLVTTLGEKGSVIELGVRCQVSGVRCWKIPPARPKNTSDPTGAGDAYRAGLIKGLLLGLPLPKVGRLAATVAVYTVEKYGTQTHTFSWAGLLKRYRQNFQESLLS